MPIQSDTYFRKVRNKLKLFTRTDGETTKKTIRLFVEEARREPRAVALFSTLIPLGHFLYIVLVPLLISLITQSLIEQPHNLATPLWLLGGMTLASIATMVVSHFGYVALFNHEERVTTRLAEKALDKLLRHSHGFFADQRVGSLAGDINTFSRAYLAMMDSIFLQLSSIIVNFVTSLIIIAFMAPIMLIPLVMLTVFVVVHSLTSLQNRAVYRNQRKDMQSKLFGTIADIIGNNALVRLFGKEDVEVARVVRERKAIEVVAEKEIGLFQRSAEIRQGVLFAFQIATIAMIITLFTKDMLTIGALIFIITYLGRVVGSMYSISTIVRGVEQAFLDSAKITDILSTIPDVQDADDAQVLKVKRGALDLKDVTFAYSDSKDHAVFSKLNLSIPAGQRVGLVGRSGGGKTTLTSLLLRYADIGSGAIEIDGQDISRVTQSSLRDVIGYVPQDPYLFHRTLRENIAYGNPKATDEQINKAVRQANAHEFIASLPNGLETVVGERGVKLSGGQRQRIAISRAILKDAPILVLDEATSALDSESEKLIQQSLEALMKNRTSIVIAHRLSTIAKLDRIIVLDDGKIVEDGSHAELLKNGGTYASLWNHQSGGFLEE